MKYRTSSPAACLPCDPEKPEVDARRSQIAIRTGDVHRASRAADGVYLAAQGPNGPEHGVVLMSAILLIERLAVACRCDPRAVIRMIEHCFDRKAELMHPTDRCN